MSVNSYLMNISSSAIIRDVEKTRIQASINTLHSRLISYFGSEIDRSLIFGSYSRNTILPRHMDIRSDIDYMVVFADDQYQPQTYLNQLRRFVQSNYPRSSIAQSNPTIILSLNHINFELVPAIETWFSGLRIPAKAADYANWIETDPSGFNQELTNKNTAENSLIKPLVRVMKYWNASSGYPFESYELEQMIVNQTYWSSFFGTGNRLEDYFYGFVDSLESPWGAAQWRRDAVDRLKRYADSARDYESRGYVTQAENALEHLLPQLGLMA